MFGPTGKEANVFAFLTSDEASYISAAVIEVSGGTLPQLRSKPLN
jgi:NAD(P)-dependent dehydrogenase (short-subunit alcohol dehydrogenase family)